MFKTYAKQSGNTLNHTILYTSSTLFYFMHTNSVSEILSDSLIVQFYQYWKWNYVILIEQQPLWPPVATRSCHNFSSFSKIL